MKRKRNLNTFFLRMLRKAGMLCKKTQPSSPRIRISKTINPDGSETKHEYITSVPENKDSFAAELHVYHEIKKINK
jgi:hypothetical protein